jgi:DNA mismatch endonuclease (patch repair protein)
MADVFTKEKRSEVMRAVHSKNTKPEMIVRRIVSHSGFRYRLHQRDLPGCPDFVFKRAKKAIFVHGCFWHLHAKCSNVRIPKSGKKYWLPKLKKNHERDKVIRAQLKKMGWLLLTIWECELKKINNTEKRIKRFLEN